MPPTAHIKYRSLIAPRRRPGDPIVAGYTSGLALLAPLTLLCILMPFQTDASAESFNTLGPFYYIGILAMTAYGILRRLPEALWTPAFWLPVSMALFFGFGPLVEVFGNEATRLRLSRGFLAISETELAFANRLSFLFSWGVLAGFWLHCKVFREAWRATLTEPEGMSRISFSPGEMVCVFVIGGMLLKYLLILPSQWGVMSIIVPGALTSVSALLDVGFGLAAYLSIRGHRGIGLLLLLWPLHFGLSALTFSKVALVMSMLFLVIGVYFGNRKRWMLLLSLLLISFIYSLSQPFVSYSRAVIHERTGTIWNAGYAERLDIAGSYFRSPGISSIGEHSGNVEDADIDDWWLRLNYSNVQAIAKQLRESGQYINSYDQVWVLFIPRIIWPNKPVFISPGMVFYTFLTGNHGTALGLSVFGDLYWQLGWSGFFATLFIGWLLACMTRRSVCILRRHDYLRMPLVLLPLLLSISGLTQFFVNGIIAVIPIYLAYMGLAYIADRILLSRSRR